MKPKGPEAAGGATAVAALGVFAGPVGVGFAGGFAIGQGLMIAIDGLGGLGGPPPPMNHRDFAVLPAPPAIRMGAFWEEVQPKVRDYPILNGWIPFVAAGEQAVVSARGLSEAVEKSLVAFSSDRACDAVLQREVAYAFADALDAQLSLMASALRRLLVDLGSHPFLDTLADVVIDRSEVARLNHEIVASGQFPDFERRLIGDLDLSDAEFDALLAVVDRMDCSTLPDRMNAFQVLEQLVSYISGLCPSQALVRMPSLGRLASATQLQLHDGPNRTLPGG